MVVEGYGIVVGLFFLGSPIFAKFVKMCYILMLDILPF